METHPNDLDASIRLRTSDRLCRLFLLFSLFGLLITPALAQVTSGSLTGVVTDPTGAVIPGAKVNLTDASKGYNYPATTDSVGRYVIANLLPSTYKLSVEAPGFRTYLREGIVVDVGARVAVDARLEVGGTAQAVEVTGAAPVLSTQDAVTGQEVDRALINDLPLVGRAVFDLAFLAPGVIQAPGATFGPQNNGNNFVSNGGRNATALRQTRRAPPSQNRPPKFKLGASAGRCTKVKSSKQRKKKYADPLRSHK